jgi:molybdopterin converting factor subunit 1
MIRVALFAQAREIAGRQIDVSLTEGATVGELRAAIVRAYPQLERMVAVSRFAVNHEFTDDSHIIPAAAEVALIPPVSGG